MGFTHIDLIGLNKHEMHDAPIVRTGTELKTLAEISQASQRSLSIAGMRHSQGGHTALDGERMVFTEAMEQSIGKVVVDPIDPKRMTVKINAGATWSDLHFNLGPQGFAPLVHQSSPHFSIGGSLSVDCHGREVHEGALSNTVESITVLTNKNGKLEETKASRDKNENPDLFFAALGGYGACGVILDATIRITENKYMYKFGTAVKSLADLSEFLDAASQGIRKQSKNLEPAEISMFYAWMDVSHVEANYLTHAMVYEYIPQDVPSLTMRVKDFKNEGWAGTEAMRAAWSAGRRDPALRGELFKIIAKKTNQNPDGNNSRINFLREEISFTSSKGDTGDVDLLQEFFIPLPEITEFLEILKQKIPIGNKTIEVLSCTLRVVKPPPEAVSGVNNKPFLSYAYRGIDKNTPIVSVALEVKVNKEPKDNTQDVNLNFKVHQDALIVIRKIIDEARRLGGSYYLPYYPAADLEQFRAAYPDSLNWKAQADLWNPKINGLRLFNNEFLKNYLDKPE